MTRTTSLIVVLAAALVVTGSAFGKGQPVDESQHAVLARNEGISQHTRLQMAGASTVDALDVREEAFGAKRDAQLASTPSSDAFQRAVNARTGSVREPVVDDRFRIDPSSTPAPVVTASGREVEWPQIGIGFAIGVLLAAGLFLTMRLSRTRQLAH